MSQQAAALLEQIRALDPADREWISVQLLNDEEGEIDDLTEAPEFYEELVRRMNDPRPSLSWDEVQRNLELALEKSRAERSSHVASN